MDLQPQVLSYAALLDSNPSAFANDVLAGCIEAVRTGERPRFFNVINQVRRKLGKPDLACPPPDEGLDAERQALIARVVAQASENTARIVPVLRECKAQGQLYAEAKPLAFGILVSDLTRDVERIYGSDTARKAAAESLTAAGFGTGEYFQGTRYTHALFGEVYEAVFFDLMAREIVREVPAIFLPRPEPA